MRTYEKPTLTSFGSVASLTGVVGSENGIDILVVNGTTLEDNDDDFNTPPDGSCLLSLRGSIGQLSYEGGGGGEAACTSYFLDNYYGQ